MALMVPLWLLNRRRRAGDLGGCTIRKKEERKWQKGRETREKRERENDDKLLLGWRHHVNQPASREIEEEYEEDEDDKKKAKRTRCFA